MLALIWGAGGQDGYYLTGLLKKNGITVIGIGRSEGLMHVDIADFVQVSQLIKEFKPDYIFHFAANSTVKHEAWQENYSTIGTGSLHILQAVKDFAPRCKVFLSGSGLQFVNNGNPIKETDDFDPSSIYSVFRIQTVYLARYYRSLGIAVYIGYFFHHDSPLRSERHINKMILATAKRISEGSKEKLELGDITVKKEFGFAGDVVRGVWQLVNQDQVFEAVIGTGKAYAIHQWVEICFSMFGLNWEQHYTRRDGFVPDFKVLLSDPSTIQSLGWKPEVDIYNLAKLMSE